MKGEEALLERILAIAEGLGLDRLMAGILIRVIPSVEVACWVYNKTRGSFEIHFNPARCEGLPDDLLTALLLHELYHHLGFSEHHHLQDLPCPPARNLSFDIALEKVLMAGPYGPAIARLSDMLRLGSIPKEGPLSRSQCLPLLVHSTPPLDRMPADFCKVWEYLWKTIPFPSPEVCYQQILPLFESLQDREAGDGAGKGPPSGDDRRRSLETTGEGGLESEDGRPAGAKPDADPELFPDNEVVFQDPTTGAREVLAVRALPEDLEDGPAPALQIPRSVLEELGRGLPQVICGGPSWLKPFCVDASAPRHDRACRLADWLLRIRDKDRAEPPPQEARTIPTQEDCRLPYLIHPTRAEIVRQRLGILRFYYTNRRKARWVPPEVYLDVSGSMSSSLPDIVAVLRAIERLLPARLWAFDSMVRPLRRDEAVRGNIFRGSSTSFDAVFLHALSQGARSILLLTDGESVVSVGVKFRAKEARLRARAILFTRRGHCPGAEEGWHDVFEWFK